MKTIPKLALTLLAIVLCAAAPSTFANLVSNPGFETGDFTAWTQSGDTTFTGVDDSNPHSGTFAAFFGPFFSNGFISQDLATMAGGSYDLSFWLTDDSTGPDHFEVSWNGVVIFSLDSPGAFDYTQFTFNGLAAPTSSTPLQFGFFNEPGFWHLDDVSVEASSAGVPEALSTFWVVLPFAGMIGAQLLRRRTA